MAYNTLKPYIIIVEDDRAVATVIQYNLAKEGYMLRIVEDGDALFKHLEERVPDLIMLDVMLPKQSGIEICAMLRTNRSTAEIPILICSAKNDDLDKVTGLEYGADDYLTKPFAPIELSARIKALLRRTRPLFAKREICVGNIVLDLTAHQATRNNVELDLTPIEFQILHTMLESPNVVFSRKMLIDKIWHNDEGMDERIVDVHITGLRKELMKADPTSHDPIKTVRKAGYKLSAL